MKTDTTEVHERRPEGFQPRAEVAICYLEVDGQILFLKRATDKLEGGTWGVPGGKLERGETPQDGARRELFEETGVCIESPSQLQFLGELYVRKPEIDYTLHLFQVRLDQKVPISLSDEHEDYKWASSSELEAMPLMAGAHEVLVKYRTFLSRKRKGNVVLSVYLLLRQGDRLCLHLRKNSGYNDGHYGLISGHVEEGESATAAMIREAEEEAGLRFTASGLRVAHVMHRKAPGRLGMELFFECTSWEGTLENREPHKCGGLTFFPVTALPPNTIPYIADAARAVARGEFYSETGWIE